MKKKEVIFIGGLLLAGIVLWLLLPIFRGSGYGSIRITVDGKTYGTYSLGEDQIIPINDTNVCEIKDGQAFMIEAHCPDHLCMEQTPVGNNGGSIICLPNKVIIEGEKTASSGNSPEVDAVA